MTQNRVYALYEKDLLGFTAPCRRIETMSQPIQNSVSEQGVKTNKPALPPDVPGIRELRWVSAEELDDNPGNWRKHYTGTD